MKNNKYAKPEMLALALPAQPLMDVSNGSGNGWSIHVTGDDQNDSTIVVHDDGGTGDGSEARSKRWHPGYNPWDE